MLEKLIALATAGLVIGAAATGAFAEGDPATTDQPATTAPSESTADASASTEVHGVGALWARGHGHAHLNGKGRIHLAMKGDITIRDLGGDARVFVDDREQPRLAWAGDVIHLRDIEARVHIVGSHVVVDAEGSMVIRARGKGRAVLAGEGVYRTRHDRGRWLQPGTELHFDDGTAGDAELDTTA